RVGGLGASGGWARVCVGGGTGNGGRGNPPRRACARTRVCAADRDGRENGRVICLTVFIEDDGDVGAGQARPKQLKQVLGPTEGRGRVAEGGQERRLGADGGREPQRAAHGRGRGDEAPAGVEPVQHPRP
ncbi:hypothetical protein EG873_15710, partial [Enterococcus faecalis]